MSDTSTGPVVGIVMGSDSDWPVMEQAALALDELGIAYEADVVSAHRMPDDMIRYGRTAAERGLRVIIAGAGGAAHNAGLLAARILASDPAAGELRDRLAAFADDLRQLAVDKGQRLRDR